MQGGSRIKTGNNFALRVQLFVVSVIDLLGNLGVDLARSHGKELYHNTAGGNRESI